MDEAFPVLLCPLCHNMVGGWRPGIGGPEELTCDTWKCPNFGQVLLLRTLMTSKELQEKRGTRER